MLLINYSSKKCSALLTRVCFVPLLLLACGVMAQVPPVIVVVDGVGHGACTKEGVKDEDCIRFRKANHQKKITAIYNKISAGTPAKVFMIGLNLLAQDLKDDETEASYFNFLRKGHSDIEGCKSFLWPSSNPETNKFRLSVHPTGTSYNNMFKADVGNKYITSSSAANIAYKNNNAYLHDQLNDILNDLLACTLSSEESKKSEPMNSFRVYVLTDSRVNEIEKRILGFGSSSAHRLARYENHEYTATSAEGKLLSSGNDGVTDKNMDSTLLARVYSWHFERKISPNDVVISTEKQLITPKNKLLKVDYLPPSLSENVHIILKENLETISNCDKPSSSSTEWRCKLEKTMQYFNENKEYVLQLHWSIGNTKYLKEFSLRALGFKQIEVPSLVGKQIYPFPPDYKPESMLSLYPSLDGGPVFASCPASKCVFNGKSLETMSPGDYYLKDQQQRLIATISLSEWLIRDFKKLPRPAFSASQNIDRSQKLYICSNQSNTEILCEANKLDCALPRNSLGNLPNGGYALTKDKNCKSSTQLASIRLEIPWDVRQELQIYFVFIIILILIIIFFLLRHMTVSRARQASGFIITAAEVSNERI